MREIQLPIAYTAVLTAVAALLQAPHDPNARAEPPRTGTHLPVILRVGKGRPLARPSQAAAIATDGALIEIDAGTYVGDAAVWRANGLMLRGVGGRVHLAAHGVAAERKGTWVIKGRHTTVEDIDFSGASVPDRNGAGIRQEGPGLVVLGCTFHDNEDGILTGADPDSDIRIEDCEFVNNGQGDGYSHNMYIGHVRSFTLRGCYVHRARIGHNVKTRAATNFILYNRIMDEAAGTASFTVDIPNGGASYVVGNILEKGPRAQNSVLVNYAEEGPTNPSQVLCLVNNTLVNDLGQGTFLHAAGPAPQVRVVNNIFAGTGTILAGPGTLLSNLAGADPRFVDAARYDYHLRPGSPAIVAGSNPGSANGFDLNPRFQYHPPTGLQPRQPKGKPDIGAFAFTAATSARPTSRPGFPSAR